MSSCCLPSKLDFVVLVLASFVYSMQYISLLYVYIEHTSIYSYLTFISALEIFSAVFSTRNVFQFHRCYES